MGLTSNFDGTDVSQTNAHIKLSYATCINRPVTSHSWKEDKQMKDVLKTIAPLNTEAFKQLHEQKGPLEGTAKHKALEVKSGFGCRTLLGEMMHACAIHRPDIGCAITLLSKFSSGPSACHCACPKNVAQHLSVTRDQGIQFARPLQNSDPEPLKSQSPEIMHATEKLPPHLEPVPQGKLVGFADAACANDLAKKRSTTGCVFTHLGGATVCRSETQLLTALGSAETEFIAAVTAAKTAKCIRLILAELGFEQNGPTPACKDNKPVTDIVALQKPTEQTHHTDMQFFAIQNWAHNSKDTLLSHIPGVIDPSDDLTKPLRRTLLHKRHARHIMGH